MFFELYNKNVKWLLIFIQFLGVPKQIINESVNEEVYNFS